ncbi:MAG TPA: transposase [Chloroflexia bacterium]|nr:transposase [Chloroflexia bacterium]
MRRGELTDTQWAKIAPLRPPEHPGKPGHPRQPHRPVLNGMLWILRTGAPWRDVPARSGPYQTIYDRCVRCQRSGLWTQIVQTLPAQEDAQGRLGWAEGSTDSTILRPRWPAFATRGCTRPRRAHPGRGPAAIGCNPAAGRPPAVRESGSCGALLTPGPLSTGHNGHQLSGSSLAGPGAVGRHSAVVDL